MSLLLLLLLLLLVMQGDMPQHYALQSQPACLAASWSQELAAGRHCQWQKVQQKQQVAAVLSVPAVLPGCAVLAVRMAQQYHQRRLQQCQAVPGRHLLCCGCCWGQQ
jgi:hypothetical protein